jgi:hypothetical protein
MEELALQKLKTSGEFHGRILVSFKNFTLGIGQLSGSGYIALLRAHCQKKPMLFHSARRTLLQTLLKVWEEYRNPFFYNPSEDLLKKYSKSSKLFSDQEILALKFLRSKKVFAVPQINPAQITTDLYRGHHIAYVKRSVL